MTQYRYAVDVLTERGERLGRVDVDPPWRPALAWVQLEGMRAGRLRPTATVLPGTIEPEWDATAGRPYVRSFRAAVGDVVRSIPKTYLRELALEASAPFVRAGLLRSGDAFRWTVSAHPAEAAPPATGDFAVDDDERPLACIPAPLSAFLDAATCDAAERDGAIPVFVPRRVIDEAIAAAVAAGDVETGGVLIGLVHRDVDTPELFLEVTAQVPAEHARAGATTLTFTSETWAAVQRAVSLRRRSELLLGWWHAHQDFCRMRGCPLERRRTCTAAAPFWSAEDVCLHRAVFGSAHHVGLLVSDGAITGGRRATMFGWWQGVVVPRGFHVLERKE